MTFGPHLGWELVARRNSHVTRMLELSVPPLACEEGRGLEDECIASGQ